MAKNHTSISVTPTTRNRIRNLKRGGQTYDELFQEILQKVEAERTLRNSE